MSQSEGWEPQPGERVIWYPQNAPSLEVWVIGEDQPDPDGRVVVRNGPGQLLCVAAASLAPIPRTVTVEVEVPVDEARRVADFRSRYPKGIPIAADRYVDALLAALADHEPTP